MGLLKMVLTSSLNRMIFLLNYTCQAICEESGEEIICQSPKVTHITCRHIFEDTCSLSILLPLANSCITLVKMMVLEPPVPELKYSYKPSVADTYFRGDLKDGEDDVPIAVQLQLDLYLTDRPSNANMATLFKQLDEDVAYIDK
ncbi:hypothetical protein Gotur_005800 [Gossypium turneri]